MEGKEAQLATEILSQIEDPKDMVDVFKGIDLQEINLRGLLLSLLKQGHWFFFEYVVALRHELINLDYEDFLYILHDLSTYRRTSVMRFLENYVESVYMFLGIDLLGAYANLGHVDPDDQRETLLFYYQRPGTLCRSNQEGYLESYGLGFAAFDRIKNKLISQGAKEAALINPGPHTHRKHGIEIFSVQGAAPQSWTWIDRGKP